MLLVTDENYLKHSEKDKLFQSFNGHSERIKFKKEEISIKSFYRILWNMYIDWGIPRRYRNVLYFPMKCIYLGFLFFFFFLTSEDTHFSNMEVGGQRGQHLAHKGSTKPAFLNKTFLCCYIEDKYFFTLLQVQLFLGHFRSELNLKSCWI